jgi:hypothetical protein
VVKQFKDYREVGTFVTRRLIGMRWDGQVACMGQICIQRFCVRKIQFGSPRPRHKDNIKVKLGKACTGHVSVRTRDGLGHL